MTPIFIFALCLGVISAAPTLDPSLGAKWQEWKTKHRKTYKTNEGQKRAVWEKNMKMIEQHNEQISRGKYSFRMKMNAFGDLTSTEFKKLMTGFQSQGLKNMKLLQAPQPSLLVGDVSKSVDWRTKGYVSAVQDQGISCGSCWAFSSAGSLEGQMFRKTGKLVPLSAQNLVDCSSSYGNKGCNGGLMHQAFQYVKDNGGLDTKDSYPYEEAVKGSCRYDPKSSAAKVTGFAIIPESEHVLLKAVATVGPIFVALDTKHNSIWFYKAGNIYYEPKCSHLALDHDVLVVGYGEESDGQKYWLVKNSWGERWGMDGYIKIARDKNNHCGIATYAVYPVV
ncbi:cathepsin L1-like isoform X2 [Nannospalax galili]|uniref:Cathepsin L1-like n=1 Tax=Nannospalax galili TaxID=1026970 RepID=A0A8C6WD30_NANGA|nr:cathepsin L1-like isoform X2 [Nannospalax galili]